MIGYHLIMDGVLREPVGSDGIEEILRGLPTEIGMEILTGPLAVEGDTRNPW